MNKWIEERMAVIMVILFSMFVIAAFIGAWRLPKEFRSSIIPKLNKNISDYEEFAKRLERLEKPHTHDWVYNNGYPVIRETSKVSSQNF